MLRLCENRQTAAFYCLITINCVKEPIAESSHLNNIGIFGIIKSGPAAQILVAMITLFDQHGFYARVVSINTVLLHSTRGCRKKNGAIQDNQR